MAHYTEFLFKDESNADNSNACLNKASKTLGQCILDCKNDSSCETNCVSSFKDDHSECPCQVPLISLRNSYLNVPIGKMPTWMPM